VHAAHKLLEGEVGSLVDQMLHGDVDLDEAELACKVACWCIQDDEFDRPTMGHVVQILEGQVKIGMPPIPRLLQLWLGARIQLILIFCPRDTSWDAHRDTMMHMKIFE
jgi:hypothetical protein